MTARPIDEPHRTASPLELLFDLTFVVAVAAVTAQFAHDLADGRALSGLVPFLQVFFAVWWAWMNFTWFASSYDTDDVAYRLLTMVQMAGVLVLAAGVPAAALQKAELSGPLIVIAASGLVLLFALWWLYFLAPAGEGLNDRRHHRPGPVEHLPAVRGETRRSRGRGARRPHGDRCGRRAPGRMDAVTYLRISST